jgi:subtilisin family serine protease
MQWKVSWRMGLLLAVTSIASAFPVDSQLLKALRAKETTVSAVVHFKGQLDLKPFTQSTLPRVERTKKLIEALEKYTAANAANLIRGLSAADPIKATPLWITNSLAVRAAPEIIKKLLATKAGHIERVQLDAPKGVTELAEPNASWVPDPRNISWGVEQVGAPELWAQGVDGSGILVAMMDSGAALQHPDLSPNLWRNPGETGFDEDGADKASNEIDDDSNGYIDDVVGWNFEDKNNNPEDLSGHGSQTAGIVGGAGTNGTQTGVARRATLMILRTCCHQAAEIFESATWEAMQYALKNGARVISMSLSVKPASDPSYAKWRRADEVVLAAGVVHITSTGNLGSGDEPHNIGAPSTNPPPWFHPSQSSTGGKTAVITVGATDQENAPRFYSSTGPVTWEDIDGYRDFLFAAGTQSGLMKPELCAPSEVPSTSMDGHSYTKKFGGTSSATPHVAGVAALVLSAKPDLSPAQLLEALEMSAVKVGGEFTNRCGAGRVDAGAAVEYARKRF